MSFQMNLLNKLFTFIIEQFSMRSMQSYKFFDHFTLAKENLSLGVPT